MIQRFENMTNETQEANYAITENFKLSGFVSYKFKTAKDAVGKCEVTPEEIVQNAAWRDKEKCKCSDYQETQKHKGFFFFSELKTYGF